MEMARCMSENKFVPNEYWVETVHTISYLLNRSPTKLVQTMTLEEAWSGKKPQVNHLQVSGLVAYVWITNEKH